MWGELSSECGASCLGASFLWGELCWGELSLGRVVLIPSKTWPHECKTAVTQYFAKIAFSKNENCFQ